MAKDQLISMVSLDKAPIITIGGEEIVDLTQPLFESATLSPTTKTVIVGESLAGKPHLVSAAAYVSQNHIDILFSFNGHSNPITIKGGATIKVPELKQLQNSVKRDTQKSNESIRELNKRIPEVDKRRIKFLKNSENNTGDIKTPNMNESKQQFVIDETSRKVVLGADVSVQDAVNNSINSIKKNIENESI